MKIIKREKRGYKSIIRFLNILIFFYVKRDEKKEAKEILKKYSSNEFIQDICKYNSYLPHYIIKSYKNHIDDINDNLYSKLNNNDKKEFLRWLRKEYDGIDTATKDEEMFLNKKFEEAKTIYSKRKSKNDIMEFAIDDKKVKFISNVDLVKEKESKKERLMHYYAVVHAFMLKEYIKEGFEPTDGEEILDCGAAYGDTLILFKTIFPNSPVHSFECMDTNIEYIKKNIEINEFKNAFIQEGFLYSKSGKFYFDKKENKITEEKTQICEEINTVAIDDYVQQNNLKNIGLIKFDIEGGEQEALKGAINTIKEQKPILAIPIYHLQSDIYEIPNFLKDLDLPMQFSLKWTEKLILGVDCVLFVRFEK